MNISVDELMSLQGGLSAKDVRIAQLEEEVARLKEENDQLRARALECGAKIDEGQDDKDGLFTISLKRLKAAAEKIHDLKILAVIAFILQKVLPNDNMAEKCRMIAEIVPLPLLPSLTLTAEGDLKVEGDLNDIHDNTNVNV